MWSRDIDSPYGEVNHTITIEAAKKYGKLLKEDNSYLSLDKMREYDDREYDFREGEINDDMVRLREKPGLDSKTKDHLNKGDKVTIVDESSYKQ